MALKTAEVTFTDSQGFEKTMVLSVISVVFDYKHGFTETLYELYRDDAARLAGIEPEIKSQRAPIDFSDAEVMGLILQTSEKLWATNRTQPLIDDYSEYDEHGKVVKKTKSLDELGADISDTVRESAKKKRK